MSLRSSNNPLETLNQTLYAHAVVMSFISRHEAIAGRFSGSHPVLIRNLEFWQARVNCLAKNVNMFDVTEIRILAIDDLAGYVNRYEVAARYMGMVRIAQTAFLMSSAQYR